MKLISALLISLAMLVVLPAMAQTKPTASDMEILRGKIKADKKLVVAANMQLSEAEAKNFWPVYEAYQKDLAQLNDRLGKVVMDYANAWNKGAVSDETAKKLTGEYLAIEDSELKLKRDYLPKLEKAIPGAKVARYLQIENKIRAIIKYELAANIPLMQ